MKILEKESSEVFNGFDWLNFESLRQSDGFRFEVYYETSDDIVAESIFYFHLLFKGLTDKILVQQFNPAWEWGSYCMDVWSLEGETFDYSPDNKSEPTASYLAMLQDSDIEPEYTGFCRCLDWDKFLYVTLYCVMACIAIYGMMFYIPEKQIVFYFHHTGSLGIYYKELNEEIKNIVRIAKKENMIIKYANDERIYGIVNGVK